MFDKLIDLLVQFWEDLWPTQIIRGYEMGVRLRFGRFHKVVGPGLAFKIPFVDNIIAHYAKEDTMYLPSQKLTTKDAKTVTVRGMIIYHIDDIRKWMMDVNDPQQAMTDAAMGLIAENIIQSNYEDTVNIKIMNEITKQVRRDCKQWGIYVEVVKLTDLSLSRSFNIFKEAEPHL